MTHPRPRACLLPSPVLLVLLLLLSQIALSPGSARAATSPLLVDIDWLSRHLNDSDIVLIDMSSDELQYQRFHIAGAVHLPYEALLAPRRDGVHDSIGPQRLLRLLGQLGIQRDSHVVIYDDLGGLNAARLFWELERVAHPRVSLVDGGLVKWILDGKPVTAVPTRPQPTTYRLDTQTTRDNTAELGNVVPGARSPSTVLLDVRSEEEYRGSPKQPRSGHIPGARWWEWSNAVAFDRAFTHQPDATIASALERVGLSERDTPVIVYCRTGHRAAHTYFTLRRLGFERVELYAPSMVEYTNRKDQPLTLGSDP